MKLDILAFGAHPDDVEISAGGTVAKHISLGYKVGIVDLTRGELGTRGTAEIRDAEAAAAAKILGVEVRENLNMPDGFFTNSKENQLKIIAVLRKYQPEIVICNAVSDRHPDHGKGSQVVIDACFYSGLKMIESKEAGLSQLPWRPKTIYHYIQFYTMKPDLVVDVSDFMDKKMESLYAYKSQFYNPASKEPVTAIAKKEYLESVKSRDMDNGRIIGTTYAEGFTVERLIGVDDLFKVR